MSPHSVNSSWSMERFHLSTTSVLYDARTWELYFSGRLRTKSKAKIEVGQIDKINEEINLEYI